MRACLVLLCAALLATPARAEPDAAPLGEALGGMTQPWKSERLAPP
ncbi:MAG TPA: hypothetical protein VLK85_36385 [Ramlibacter sp.]|nr:hypothetical protein [Ramlibacter sp.]